MQDRHQHDLKDFVYVISDYLTPEQASHRQCRLTVDIDHRHDLQGLPTPQIISIHLKRNNKDREKNIVASGN